MHKKLQPKPKQLIGTLQLNPAKVLLGLMWSSVKSSSFLSTSCKLIERVFIQKNRQ